MANSIASRRLLHHSIKLFAVSDADFQAAKDRVSTLTQDPGNDVKLKMYALFKQVNLLWFYRFIRICRVYAINSEFNMRLGL